MPHKEPPTKRRSRIRAHFPGDEWRGHVSSGAKYAHDEVLQGKGKRSRKIRARGYDRRYRSVEKAAKPPAAVLARGRSRDIKLGPFSYSERHHSNFPMDKHERNVEYARSFFNSKLPVVLVAAGGGAGLAAKLSEDTKKKAKKLVSSKEDRNMTKSMDIYDILNKSWDPSESDYYDLDDGLILIDKGWLGTGGKLAGGAALTGLAGYGLLRGGRALARRGAARAATKWAGTEPMREEAKKKLRKYGLYAGGGLAASIAAGTAAGNAVG
jgi:hypothetical protein